MVRRTAAGRLLEAGELSRAASRYWLGVFPLVCAERRMWTARASQIPDSKLRELALSTIHEEHGNVDGAGAFAVLAPRRRRAELVRALSAFQIIYDYVDTLVEQDAPDPVRNGLVLHGALCATLMPARTHTNYYLHHPDSRRKRAPDRDGGYLHALVERCARSLNTLPSTEPLRAPAALAARRMQIFQALNHSSHARSCGELERWAAAQTDRRLGLHWWESAAAAASSLTVFALMSAATRTGLTQELAWAVHRAYYPWVGALHVLLDSLLDHEEDLAAGRHSLIEHYRSHSHAAERIGAIARVAARSTESLPDGGLHRLILAAMAGFYLSAGPVRSPHARSVRSAVLGAIGAPARPVMLIMRTRRATATRTPARSRS